MQSDMKMKSWVHFFQAIKSGAKRHDLRSKKDRKFFVGQIITLEEYDQFAGCYTGAAMDVEVTFITSNDTPCAFSSAALDRDYCILSLKVIEDISFDDLARPPAPIAGID